MGVQIPHALKQAWHVCDSAIRATGTVIFTPAEAIDFVRRHDADEEFVFNFGRVLEQGGMPDWEQQDHFKTLLFSQNRETKDLARGIVLKHVPINAEFEGRLLHDLYLMAITSENPVEMRTDIVAFLADLMEEGASAQKIREKLLQIAKDAGNIEIKQAVRSVLFPRNSETLVIRDDLVHEG